MIERDRPRRVNIARDRQPVTAVFGLVCPFRNVFLFSGGVRAGVVRVLRRVIQRIQNRLEHAVNQRDFPCRRGAVKLAVAEGKRIFILRRVFEREIPPERPRALCKVLHAISGGKSIRRRDFIQVADDNRAVCILTVVLVRVSEHCNVHGRRELVVVAPDVLELISLVVGAVNPDKSEAVFVVVAVDGDA